MSMTEPAVRDAEDPRIRRFLEEIDAVRFDARTLAEDLSPAQFNWRADPKRWSVGQCLEHLTMTVKLYPGRIERMIAEARQRQAQGAKAYRESAFSRWFVRSMEPPPKLRTRTLGKVEPPATLDRDAVLRAFDAAHAQLADLVRRADGVSLVHGRTRSPFFALLRFTLGQVFALNLAHARRHLWQARQVRSSAAFPDG